MSYDNKDEIQIESEFNELNISDSNSNVNHENCYKPNDGKLWCKECVPRYIIEGWTSGNNSIDEFIKDTIYDAKIGYDDYDDDDDDGSDGDDYPIFLEWVPFNKFEDIKQIGEGGFSKVYSAIWIDGKAKYIKQDDGSWKKKEPEPKKIALKKLNESQNISADYLNEIKIFWNFYLNETTYRCMSAIPNQRPTASELCDILDFWNYTFEDEYLEEEKFGYKGKEIKTVFDEANKEIPKISTTYEKNSDAIYTSRLFTFNNLPKPINSSIITSYLNEDNKD
ncbi:unnamed protein product [Rhizophagus irregularis]|nr:unnamed protein product [Rhizophagus irregularis]